MTVIVYQCTADTDLSDLDQHMIPADWYGEPAEFGISYLLAIKERVLHFHFTANYTPDYDWPHGSGDFVEGLWKEDVAELFIGTGDGTAYQEFNFSPSGAWWTQMFSDYRVEAPELLRRPPVNVSSEIGSIGWELVVALRLDDLSLAATSAHELNLNICTIFGKNPRRYFSALKIDNSDPDFHLMSSAPKISLC